MANSIETLKWHLTEEQGDEILEFYQETKYLRSLQLIVRGITHRYNNIFSGLLGNLETFNSGKHLETREVLTSLVSRATDETEILYSFARHRQISNQKMSFSGIAENTIRALNTVSPRHTVQLNYKNSVSTIRGLDNDLALALFYLGENGIEAMAGGGEVLFEVSIVVDEFNLSWVSVAVTDEGPGVDQKLVDTIFSPFVTTKNKTSHYGLGLYLARKIVEKHGGQLTYSSESDKKHFLLRLPAAMQNIPEAKTAPEAKNEKTAPKQIGKQVFFVIDDDPTLLDYLVEGLQRRGHIVFSASSCTEALEEFPHVSNIVTLFLVDIGLTDCYGFECIERFMAMYDVPLVIYMSGEKNTIIENDIHKSNIFIGKPFTIKQLEEVVANVEIPAQ